MQGENDRLAHAIEQVDQPFAALAAEQSVFVLDVQQLGGMRIHETRDLPVAVAIVFGEALHHLRRITPRFAARLVDRDDVATQTECPAIRFEDILRKGRYAALARRIGTKQEHAHQLPSRPLVYPKELAEQTLLLTGAGYPAASFKYGSRGDDCIMTDDASLKNACLAADLGPAGDDRALDDRPFFDANVIPKDRIAHDCSWTNRAARSDHHIRPDGRARIDGDAVFGIHGNTRRELQHGHPALENVGVRTQILLRFAKVHPIITRRI